MRTMNFMVGLAECYEVGRPRVEPECDIYPVTRSAHVAFCPECGVSANVKDYTVRNVFHVPVRSRPTLLELKVRRYVCPVCGSTFTDEPLISKHCPHVTCDLYDMIVAELSQKQSLSQISAHLGPSVNILTAVLDSVDVEYDFLPRTLCIDELKANTDKGKMAVCIVDGDNGFLVDLLGNQKTDTINTFFWEKGHNERSHVEYFCCDMSGQFISLGTQWFPNAVICVDNFHVAKRVTKAVNDVRIRIQDRIGNGTLRADTKRNWRLFTHRRDSLDDTGKRKVDALLADPELIEAYRFLQLYFDVRDLPYSAKNKGLLIEWMTCAMDSDVAEIRAAGTTLYKHRKYIANAMRYGKTNAYAEGINNSIKVIKRVSYGCPKFERFRKRCLLCLGPVRFEPKGVYLPKVSK